ncbi:MAG TPA: sigma-70 family RNA polymerase sigma factor [Cyclobacteriaceae bacterium]|jgi:RNA polymerase sigma-70 factor (ECF subfamily)|nr:sigma-70 family RNA polymerase sigma factor [Cyclobacteriaceae bacterium]
MIEQSLHVQKAQQHNEIAPGDRGSNATSEGQLWVDFLQGDDNAVTSLYHLYANKLYNYGRQFTADKDLVLDAVQDVFLNLIRTRSKLSVATSVKFYLYASFRHSIIRQLKRNTKFVRPNDMADEGFQISVNATYLSVNSNFNGDQKKIVEHFCNKLPARQREAVVLHYFEELSYDEIAKTMNLSTTKSARTMVYRALDSLSVLLLSWKKELTIFTGSLFFLF